MKKLILLLALVFVMCGCDSGYNKTDSGLGSPHSTVIDSCEYITWGNGLSHKGNCKYCAERRRKEQEELIRKIKEQ